MSRYNQCKECLSNDDGYCNAGNKDWTIDYFQDTSDCQYFERNKEVNR